MEPKQVRIATTRVLLAAQRDQKARHGLMAFEIAQVIGDTYKAPVSGQRVGQALRVLSKNGYVEKTIVAGTETIKADGISYTPTSSFWRLKAMRSRNTDPGTGRPTKCLPQDVVQWRKNNGRSISETAAHFGISEATVKRYALAVKSTQGH